MARFASTLIPASEAPINIAALATVTASSVKTIGKNRIFAINADQDISITFGTSTNIVTPSATSYRIPANTQDVFDLGSAADSFQVFNLSGSNANIYVQLLSVV